MFLIIHIRIEINRIQFKVFEYLELYAISIDVLLYAWLYGPIRPGQVARPSSGQGKPQRKRFVIGIYTIFHYFI